MTIQEAIEAGFTHRATHRTVKDAIYFVEYDPETGDYLDNGGVTRLSNPEENFIIHKLTDLKDLP